MQLLARAGYLAVMLVFGQYVLAGSGFGCRAASQGDAGAMATVVMTVQAVPDHDGGCGAPQKHASCALDGVTCSAMAGCASVVMTVVAPQMDKVLNLTRELVAAVTGDVAAHHISPEPPPPRA